MRHRTPISLRTWNRVAGIAFFALAIYIMPLLLAGHDAFAIPAGMPDGTCTNDPQFDVQSSSLISSIIINILSILNTAMGTLFNSISGNPDFMNTVRALITLYIAIYGVMFTVGMVQATVFDFTIRLIKIGILTTLISPTAWGFFSSSVVTFFVGGMNDIINFVMGIAVGGVSTAGTPPFQVLDDAVAQATSTRMAITVMAIFSTGPYGLLIGGVLAMALGLFLKTMLNALWVYLMSMVMLTLLFGIAPIFIACMLFQRTRHIFDGWLNQVVNAVLQPTLLFTFFAFFCVLIQAALANILATPVCWTELAEGERGGPFSPHVWRAALNGMPFGGQWTFTGANGGALIFPWDIMTVLVLLILVELCSRFNAVVIEIAKDIAGAATTLGGFSGAMSDWFGGRGAGGGQPAPAGAGAPAGGQVPAPAFRQPTGGNLGGAGAGGTTSAKAANPGGVGGGSERGTGTAAARAGAEMQKKR